MYQAVHIPVPDIQVSDILLAFLGEAGFEGFQQEEGLLSAFIPLRDFDQAALDAICRYFGLTYSGEKIPETNWNRIWEEQFEPVCLGDFCSVRASFHPPQPGFRFDLIINPKMSFGTGHHASTRLMIEAISHWDLRGRKLADFGTGTGILALLAIRMRAVSVLAMDQDPLCLENAAENADANGVRGNLLFLQTDRMVPGPYDLVLANISRHVLLDQWSSLSRATGPGGRPDGTGDIPQGRMVRDDLGPGSAVRLSSSPDWKRNFP